MNRANVATALAAAALSASLLAGSSGRAAPAPDMDRPAREAFEALKKRLPTVVAAWTKDTFGERVNEYAYEVKSARRIGPAEAKLTLTLTYTPGGRRPRVEHVLVIFLRYYDGSWTTTRYEPRLTMNNPAGARDILLLMLAIDESKEK
jgi:hypothetical protein